MTNEKKKMKKEKWGRGVGDAEERGEDQQLKEATTCQDEKQVEEEGEKLTQMTLKIF